MASSSARRSSQHLPTHRTTDRLQLYDLALNDLDEVHHLHSLPETDQYNTLGLPNNKAATRAIVQRWIAQHRAIPRRHFTWTITCNTPHAFIGLIALILGEERFRSGSVWYKLLPAYWRRGYATEALREVLRFGFETLHLHRIEAGCATENIASARVLEKAGMQREGSKRKVLPIRGCWIDNYEYAILEEDWMNLHHI